MSSPIPEDPYDALGVAKDADISVIRSAHRKLVLKYHPDRIKDEAERAKGKDLFQKVQQAYELLSDPAKRERYDNKVKLAELRKEAMMREPVRSATYPMRPAPSPMSTPREYRDGAYFEERVPAGTNSYFDSKERFEEPVSRASSRKYDEYERRPSSKSGEKEKRSAGGSSSKWERPVAGMSFGAAFNLKKKANEARERVKTKETKERDHATKAKTRDREIRRERSDTQGRRAFVVDDESDSDTATYVSQATVRPAKQPPKSKAKPEPAARRSSPPRSGSRRDDEEDTYDDKWERLHMSSREYQQQSRPSLVRGESDVLQYWDGDERGYSRRSGSDSDRRPTSSKSRRPDIDVSKTRQPPSMPAHTSAPSNLRAHLEEREPAHQRSTSSGTIPREREHRREMPSFGRSQTMPTSRSAKKDSAPSKGSNLKHTETTQDSGYSSSSPHTPEMRGASPTRENTRESTRSSKRYQIVEPVEDEEYSSRGHRTVLIDEEDRHRRVSSPQRDRSDRRERSERSERAERPKLATDSRARSNRVPSAQIPPDTRAQPSRYDSGRTPPLSRDSPRSPRDSPPVSRHNSGRGKLFGEVFTEDREPAPYASRRYPPESVSTSPRIDPDSVNHGPYHRRRDSQDDREHDYFPGSRHRQELREPMGSRRGSVF